MASVTREITSIAQVGIVWGLKQIKALLDANAQLAEQIHIILLNTDSVSNATLTRFAASLAAHQEVQGSYQPRDPAITKITAIMKEFNICAQANEKIFVACGGKGDINRHLQNNPTLFAEAKKQASDFIESEDYQNSDINYAVFIDNDVKRKLISLLPKPGVSTAEPVSFLEEQTLLDRYEAQAQPDPSERFAMLNQSCRKLQNEVENYALVETNSDKMRSLNFIQKLADSHCISMARAGEAYRQLKDDGTAEKAALTKRLEKNRELLNLLENEMEEREESHRKELEATEAKHKELLTKMRSFETVKNDGEASEKEGIEEKINNLNQEIQNLLNDKNSLTLEFDRQKLSSEKAIAKLEEEKYELALRVDKKDRALVRLEELHTQTRKEAEDVIHNLEEQELTPVYISRKLAKPSALTPGPHTTLVQKRGTEVSDRQAMPRPRTRLSFEDNHNSPSLTPVQNQVLQTQRPNQRPIICKPANFGLNTWNPLTTDIYVHLDKALKAGREALNVGASTTSVRRMILNSLGPKCDHVENFIEDPESMTLAKFAEAIGRILGKKSSVQMQSFLTAQRRSGEDLLAYFTRLHMLYRSSNKLTEQTDWEQDATHSMSFYSKIYDACYQAQKTELIRKTEVHLEKGDLTLPKLKGILVEVNKIDASKLSAEEPQIALLNNQTAYNKEINAQENENRYGKETDPKKEKKINARNNDWRKRVHCWHCNKLGHTKLECFQYIRKMKEEKGNPRETKTRGSRPQESNTQH